MSVFKHKIKYISILIILTLTIIISCTVSNDAEDEHNFAVLTVHSNNNPIKGVLVLINNVEIGTTGEDGSLAVENIEGETFNIQLYKKFFASKNETVTLDYFLENKTKVYEVEITAQIFVPDYGNKKVIRIDDMDGTNREEIISVPGHTFNGPSWVEVDYENGYIYILDTAGKYVSDSCLIQIDDFPAAGSGTKVVALYDDGPPVRSVYGPGQLSLTPEGKILIAFQTNGALMEMDSIDDVETGTIYSGFTNDVTGVTCHPDGGYLILNVIDISSKVYIKAMDDITGTNLDNFIGPVNRGSLDNELDFSTKILADSNGYLYISDIGEPSASSNHRLVRYDLYGSNRSNYGSFGTNIGQFQYPMLLGILPDKRIYIIDIGNQRLVSIDSFEKGDTSWQEYKPSGVDSFSFDYWYNAC
jgi:hypothetical protein